VPPELGTSSRYDAPVTAEPRTSRLFALDPGTEHSAVAWIGDSGRACGYIWTNDNMLSWLRAGILDDERTHLVIEQVESFGMAVGREVFETVFWSGRFAEAWEQSGASATWSMLGRKAVKLTLCGSARAKDANIRQALLDRFGGKEKAIGKKAAPGPLYGVRSHLWAALALAVAYQEQEQSR
jgi:hypothetical protein